MIDDATTKKIVLNNGGRYSVPDVEYWLQDGEIIFSPAALELYTRAIEQLARQEQREADARIAEKQADEYGGQDYYAIGCTATAEAIRASGKENGNE